MGFKMGFDDILCTKNRISCKSLRSKCLRGYAWSDFQGSDWVSRFARISFDRFFNTYIVSLITTKMFFFMIKTWENKSFDLINWSIWIIDFLLWFHPLIRLFLQKKLVLKGKKQHFLGHPNVTAFDNLQHAWRRRYPSELPASVNGMKWGTAPVDGILQLIGSSSHFLRVVKHPNGGCLRFLNHQQYD